MSNLAVAREMIRAEFQRMAEWRRQKAVEFPDDVRNLKAAEILDRLAGTVDNVDGAVLEASVELFEELSDAESYHEMLRQVGFHSWPETASEFVSGFIKERTSGP